MYFNIFAYQPRRDLRRRFFIYNYIFTLRGEINKMILNLMFTRFKHKIFHLYVKMNITTIILSGIMVALLITV